MSKIDISRLSIRTERIILPSEQFQEIRDTIMAIVDETDIC